MDKLRIAKWYDGKFGYRSFFQLQAWNSVYKHWYSLHDALLLQFIESYCVMKQINFKDIPIVEINKED